ncbi:TetR/AcrR family transcriptional regulator [Streptomyces sp. NPDC101234]|uniref:TetR/AcrR family transcriptional regulator n=1 Tax=Streptomyces sp. NPDC101234 TaxID=3366138 RepID=UPI00382CEB41
MTTPGDASQDTARDALVSAARALFPRKGYGGTRITEIARAAGTSVSTFYSRFDSKEDAYRAAMGSPPPKAGANESELGARAQRSRKALLVAARACIERDGYAAARISDIAAEAKVAVGTFYTYFPSKLEVFTEVLHQGLLSELKHTRMQALHEPVATDGADGPEGVAEVRAQARQRIHVAVQRYFSSYSRHALLLLRVDEATGVHPELVPLRLELHCGFADHIAASLRDWQALGIIRTDLDVRHTADALAAMVGQTTRLWLTYGQPHDPETAVATLTRLWVAGIGLTDGPYGEQPAPSPEH